MTNAEMKLKQSLQETISNWIEANCESSEWEELKVYIHPECEGQMTDAAWSVLSAMAKSQAFVKTNT